MRGSARTLAGRLLDWYARNGRATLPWRTVRDPYRTLVSEFMLQQTQVERVVPAFEAFTTRFPSVKALAEANVADVLRAWKGLGYNARALRLKRTAEVVVAQHGGAIPSEAAALRALPGVGAYTTAAIRAFAFDLDDAPVDTNVRRIVHRLFFGIEYPPRAGVRALDAQARALLPPGRGHDWNSALMDLGASLCTARAPRCEACPLAERCSAAPLDAAALAASRKRYAKPAAPQNAIPFEQTRRYARGRIVDRLRALAPRERISLLDLHRDVRAACVRGVDEMERLVADLERDGLVDRRGDRIALRE